MSRRQKPCLMSVEGRGGDNFHSRLRRLREGTTLDSTTTVGSGERGVCPRHGDWVKSSSERALNIAAKAERMLSRSHHDEELV